MFYSSFWVCVLFVLVCACVCVFGLMCLWVLLVIFLCDAVRPVCCMFRVVSCVYVRVVTIVLMCVIRL